MPARSIIFVAIVVGWLTSSTVAWQPNRKASSVIHKSGSLGSSETLSRPSLHATSAVHGQQGLRRHLQQDEQPKGIAAWDPRIHGFVASISIGLLGPLAVVVSRNFREFRPIWIWCHGLLALTALIGGIIGVVFGGELPEDESFVDSVYSAHKGIGAASVALYGVQVLGALFRPNPIHKQRKWFNIVHHWMGRIGIALGIVSVFLGLHLAKELYTYWWGYAIVLGVIVLIWLSKETLDLFAVFRSNRRGPNSHKLPGPVNGSFASVFLLHGRPMLGETHPSVPDEGDQKQNLHTNGHGRRSDSIQMTQI